MITLKTKTREQFNKKVDKLKGELNWHKCDHLGKRVDFKARNGVRIASVILDEMEF